MTSQKACSRAILAVSLGRPAASDMKRFSKGLRRQRASFSFLSLFLSSGTTFHS